MGHRLCKLLLVLVRVGQERVLQQLRGVRSLLGILYQALFYEVPKRGGPARVYWRGILLHYIENYTALGLVDVRRVPVRHLHREYPKTPDIHLRGIRALSTDELGRHPADSADFTLPARFLLGQLAGITEICQLDLPVLTHEQIVRFVPTPLFLVCTGILRSILERKKRAARWSPRRHS